MLLLAAFIGCGDVRSVEGSIECVVDPGQEFVFSADVIMREQGTSPTAVLVDVSLEKTGEVVIIRSMATEGDRWETTMSMDELGTSCGAFLEDGLCYTFTATGPDRRTVEDILGADACLVERVPGSHSGGGGGGGGGTENDCSGTLVCNDGTTSCSCHSCTAGCCSGHGGCQ